MPELIAAIATLLWPLITLVMLLVFRRALGRVLRSAEKRELEFDVAGQRLTFRELNDQQNEMIQDLQRQLSIVNKKLAQYEPQPPEVGGPTMLSGSSELPQAGQPGASNGEHAQPDTATGTITEQTAPDPDTSRSQESPVTDMDLSGLPHHAQAPKGAEPFSVLWVAERPENHALLAGQLRDNGVRVSITTSTTDALAEIAKRPYRLIVTDMSRQEEGSRRADAGLTLLRELRDLGVDTPVIVFTSPRGQLSYGDRSHQLGAVATTSSAYEMVQHFQNFDLL